mgnify:FL=1
MGQIKVPKNSRVKREKPRLESSSTKEDIRCVTSPKAMPPRVVAIRSLMAGGSTSAAISHIKLPAKAYGADSQKVSPLLRAALK